MVNVGRFDALFINLCNKQRKVTPKKRENYCGDNRRAEPDVSGLRGDSENVSVELEGKTEALSQLLERAFHVV
jgi:hypothetical protein